jgi:hypothetical protein
VKLTVGYTVFSDDTDLGTPYTFEVTRYDFEEDMGVQEIKNVLWQIAEDEYAARFRFSIVDCDELAQIIHKSLQDSATG